MSLSSPVPTHVHILLFSFCILLLHLKYCPASNFPAVVVVEQIKNARSARSDAYNELKDRVKRIKAYVKAQYGVASNEYTLIKGIKV